jgi:hypothetical protein
MDGDSTSWKKLREKMVSLYPQKPKIAKEVIKNL